jgi:hypothetical protein
MFVETKRALLPHVQPRSRPKNSLVRKTFFFDVFFQKHIIIDVFFKNTSTDHERGCRDATTSCDVMMGDTIQQNMPRDQRSRTRDSYLQQRLTRDALEPSRTSRPPFL